MNITPRKTDAPRPPSNTLQALSYRFAKDWEKAWAAAVQSDWYQNFSPASCYIDCEELTIVAVDDHEKAIKKKRTAIIK